MGRKRKVNDECDLAAFLLSKREVHRGANAKACAMADASYTMMRESKSRMELIEEAA